MNDVKMLEDMFNLTYTYPPETDDVHSISNTGASCPGLTLITATGILINVSDYAFISIASTSGTMQLVDMTPDPKFDSLYT